MNFATFVLTIGIMHTVVLIALNWFPPPFYRQYSISDFIISWICFGAFYLVVRLLNK